LSEPEITLVGSDDFWERITGKSDFRARLPRMSVVLAPLGKRRASDEVARIKEEARTLFGDPEGGLDLDAVANPPKRARRKKNLVCEEGAE